MTWIEWSRAESLERGFKSQSQHLFNLWCLVPPHMTELITGTRMGLWWGAEMLVFVKCFKQGVTRSTYCVNICYVYIHKNISQEGVFLSVQHKMFSHVGKKSQRAWQPWERAGIICSRTNYQGNKVEGLPWFMALCLAFCLAASSSSTPVHFELWDIPF